MVVPVVLPAAIRHAALFPESDLLDFPPGHPTRRIATEGVVVTLPAVLPVELVFPEQVEVAGIEQLIDAVRRSLVAERRERAIWTVPEASVPAGLAHRLLALGMRPNDLPGAAALAPSIGDAAAARGAPILTVVAGAMSPPDPLERLGFSIVGRSDSRVDELG